MAWRGNHIFIYVRRMALPALRRVARGVSSPYEGRAHAILGASHRLSARHETAASWLVLLQTTRPRPTE
eukprot:3655927-Prymnesium_polylepis.1